MGWKKRLKQERKELVKRHARLGKFLDPLDATAHSEPVILLLIRQEEIMRMYIAVLDERIALLKDQ